MKCPAPHKPRWRPALLMAAALLICTPVFAQEPPDNVEYDIVRHHDSLTAWLNLARYFGETELKALKDGVSFALHLSIDLSHPKKLWGSDQIASTSRELLISYSLATKGYRLTLPDSGTSLSDRLFLSPDELRSFLTDSILIPVAPIDTLPSGRSYRLSLQVTRIALTSINLAADNQTPDNPSAIKVLFREFLRLTSYGRDEWKTTSRPFFLSEITPLPR